MFLRFSTKKFGTSFLKALSMPPDEADAMRDAQFKFEKAMFALSKATAGVRR